MKSLVALIVAAWATSTLAAEVTVIRPKSIIAEEWAYFILVGNEKRPIADVLSGERATFQVPADTRTILIHCPKSVGNYAESRVDFDFKANPRAFFVISPAPTCVTIETADARAAASLMSATRNRVSGRPIDYESQAAPASPVMAAVAPAAPRAPTGSPAKDQVAAATAAWAEAFNNRDAGRLSALYDAEAVLTDAGDLRTRVGTAAITDYYKDAVKRTQRIALGEGHIRLLGDSIAVDSGTLTYFEVHDGKPASTTPGHYSVTYQKRGGKWLIVDHHTSVPR